MYCGYRTEIIECRITIDELDDRRHPEKWSLHTFIVITEWMVACLTLVWHESVERANMYKLDKVRWGNILRGDKFDQVRSRQTVCVWLTEYCSIKRHRRVIGRLVAPFFFFFSSLPTVCLPQLEQIHTLPCPSKRLSLSLPLFSWIYTHCFMFRSQISPV